MEFSSCTSVVRALVVETEAIALSAVAGQFRQSMFHGDIVKQINIYSDRHALDAAAERGERERESCGR